MGKNTDTDKGFSLIELIIAIAILIILTGLLAPQFMKYIEKSRKAVCMNNVDVVISEYQVAVIEDRDIKPEKVLDDMVKNRGLECPSKDEYSIIHTGDELFVVNCSVHGNSEGVSSDPAVAAAQKVYNEMKDFVGLTHDEIKKITGTNSNNTAIREYLLGKRGGSWDGLDDKYSQAAGFAKNLYVQPYIFKGSKDYDRTDDVIIYAGTSKDDTGDRWIAYLLYNPDDGRWYHAPDNSTYRMQDKPWDVVKKDTIENGWIAVK